MSFILDALQRAEAQRERGAVPGLHARPVSNPIDAAATGSRKGIGLAVAGLLLIAAGVVAGRMWLDHPRPNAVDGVATTTGAAVALGVVGPSSEPAATPVALPKPAPVVATTMPQRAASTTAKAPSRPVPPVASAVASTAPPPALSLGELPEDIRRQLPALTITGAVYSDNPAQRLLLVNGQVLTQGSTVAPGVTLVEIHSGNSEFNFRGTRFRMAH